MTSRIRPRRVGELLREEISTILVRDLADRRVRLVSVTGVEMSGDLQVARVFVSAVEPGADPEKILRVLSGASGYIRQQLKRRKLPLRYLPELRFVHDGSIEEGSKIDQILGDLRRSEQDED